MTKQLNLDDFSAWRERATEQPAKPLVIDVREALELQTASVTANGFELLHIPMQSIPARLDELKQNYGTDHPTAVLCHHGVRSMQVANFLAHHGFTNLVNLQGGIDAWSHQIDTSVAKY